MDSVLSGFWEIFLRFFNVVLSDVEFFDGGSVPGIVLELCFETEFELRVDGGVGQPEGAAKGHDFGGDAFLEPFDLIRDVGTEKSDVLRLCLLYTSDAADE